MPRPVCGAIVPGTFEIAIITAGSASSAAFDIEEQRVRIERAHEETRTFVAEQAKLAAEQTELAAEQFGMTAEASKTAVGQTKLAAAAATIGRDRSLAPGRWRYRA
jgi:hypothetical protein